VRQRRDRAGPGRVPVVEAGYDLRRQLACAFGLVRVASGERSCCATNRRDGRNPEGRARRAPRLVACIAEPGQRPRLPIGRPASRLALPPATGPPGSTCDHPVPDLRRTHTETRCLACQSEPSPPETLQNTTNIFPVCSPAVLGQQRKELKNSSICGPFVRIGETGFEPATARPPA
jgi:hypothetical protein